MIRADRAAELLALTRDQVGTEEVARLAAACAEKSARLRGLLGGGGVKPEALAEALQFVFAAGRPRRRGGRAGWHETVAALVPAVGRLLAGDGGMPGEGGSMDGRAGGEPARRIERFAQEAGTVLGAAAPAVAADLLRFCRPDLAWPWAPWLWDGAGGGVLGLVLARGGSAGPPAAEAGRVYAEAGRHLAYLGALWGESVPVDGFALDAWLAAAFASYTYLVTSVGATEELALLLPGPRELAARLLGVLRLMSAAGEAQTDLALAAPRARQAGGDAAAGLVAGERRAAR